MQKTTKGFAIIQQLKNKLCRQRKSQTWVSFLLLTLDSARNKLTMKYLPATAHTASSRQRLPPLPSVPGLFPRMLKTATSKPTTPQTTN